MAEDDLFSALLNNQVEYALDLIAMGADVNARTNDPSQTRHHRADIDTIGMTPLMLATQNNQMTVVEALLADDRVELNVTDEDGWNALHFAAAFDRRDIGARLLQAGVSTSTQSHSDRYSPLHMAVENQAHEFIRRLVDTDFDQLDLAIENRAGNTPVEMAREHKLHEALNAFELGESRRRAEMLIEHSPEARGGSLETL